MANLWVKKQSAKLRSSFAKASDDDGLGQGLVDAVSGVLDGDGAAAALVGDNGDGFAAVAAQREQKGVQLVIVRIDGQNDIFLSFLCLIEGHIYHLIVA